MKLRNFFKIGQYGYAHHLFITAVVVLVAAIGVSALNANNSSTPSPKVEFVSSAPKGLPLLATNAPNSAGSQGSSGGSGSCQSGACYYWGAMTTSGVHAQGVSVNIAQADPKISPADYHSDAELMVLSSDAESIIEVGWMVSPSIFGDSQPHLFVYRWVNRTPSCYNACGFTPVSTQYTAGQAVTVGATENYEIKQARNEWQVFYAGKELGYYPDSIWSNGFTSVGEIEAFGEVASVSSTNPTTQMGNGIPGTKYSSAYFHSLKLLNPTTLNVFSYSSLQAPAVYSVGRYNQSCTNDCNMNFGGPGY